MLSEIACAGTAGALGRFITHPLDTCKTVALSSSDPNVRSVSQAAKLVWRGEGTRGFYRGVGIATLGSTPGVALYLWSYDLLKRALQQFFGIRRDSSSFAATSATHLTAGFGAEMVSCIFWVPIDVVKERLQFQTPSVASRYRGSLDGLLTCIRLEGVKGLYKGYSTTLASFGPYSGVYFTSYETILRWIRPGTDDDHRQATPWSTTLFAAFMGNVVACVATNPFEVVKTRRQVQNAKLLDRVSGGVTVDQRVKGAYTGVAAGLREIVAREGRTGLFRGLQARILYSAPNAALTMTLFEWCKGNS